MHTYFLNLWDWARTSYWFMPGLIVLAAAGVSLIMPWVDYRIADHDIELPAWILTTTGTAKATLSALTGAMMTVSGTVFSITVVTLSLTSQQFGPRLLRRFMYDVPTQVTLGVFLATGLYCLLLLRIVENRGEAEFVLHVSVFTAVFFAVVSMALLIFFIHHVAMLIQAPHVVASVAADLDDAIVRLFPEKIGESPQPEHESQIEQQAERLGEPVCEIGSKHEGYIQAIDHEGLMHLAGKHDLVLRLIKRPGDFVAEETVIAQIYSASDELPDQEKLREKINETIIAGVRSTPRQDVLCAISELVEVAVRSLSPGINDPFTAINCIDRLGATLGRLAERHMPSPYRTDGEGTLRIVTRPVTFEEVVTFSFEPIRQNNDTNTIVVSRMIEALESILSRARREKDIEVVQAEIEQMQSHRERISNGNAP